MCTEYRIQDRRSRTHDTAVQQEHQANTNRDQHQPKHSFHFRRRLQLTHASNHPVVAYPPTVTTPISADSSKHAATNHHHPHVAFLLRKACSRKNVEKTSTCNVT